MLLFRTHIALKPSECWKDHRTENRYPVSDRNIRRFKPNMLSVLERSQHSNQACRQCWSDHRTQTEYAVSAGKTTGLQKYMLSVQDSEYITGLKPNILSGLERSQDSNQICFQRAPDQNQLSSYCLKDLRSQTMYPLKG